MKAIRCEDCELGYTCPFHKTHKPVKKITESEVVKYVRKSVRAQNTITNIKVKLEGQENVDVIESIVESFPDVDFDLTNKGCGAILKFKGTKIPKKYLEELTEFEVESIATEKGFMLVTVNVD